MNYFIGSLYGNYNGYKKVKEELKLKDTDTLWILGDVMDSLHYEPDDCVHIMQDIQESENIHLIIGDHEFAHVMRYINLSDDDGYEAWVKVLNSMDPPGEDMIAYFEDADNDVEDDILISLINDCEISQFIQIGDNYFYLTHGFPQIQGEDLTEWQLKTTTGEISENYLDAIKTDKDIPEDILPKLTYKNCFVVCAHQIINPMITSDHVYHKNGVFLVGPSIPEQSIPVLAIDAAGYFYKEVKL